MKPSKVIAITGGIGSGKSAVSDILESAGYFVVDCDAITREIYDGEEAKKAIEKAFGQEFVRGGSVDRKKLGAYVFADAQRVKKLNEITHPLIFGRLRQVVEGSGKDVVFVQIPLLFETGRQNDFDKIWLVTADAETRVRRVKQRDGLDEKQIYARIKNQLSDEKKAAFAHTIIKNDGTVDDLRKQVLALVREL